ncbi:MAG: DNA gyrase/topoisomerase IV subunit A [Bacteroidetes bacterium]|nr:DNA gyrase/topoisomerase IV subunit A [Bacteroidota bacterium]
MTENDDELDNISESENEKSELQQTINLSGMYQNWFLDYSSYVILERAIPDLNDGLKPVQRRLLHSMKELDDGRYNKVANIIGHTMKYHPHGDASIGDALVQLGQKDILIDMQGNWGNVHTGDSAAAPRYIEARLSKFASEVVFNPKTTNWKASYDGRNKEPITLPVKFPLLLAQGVEGIAVGLATIILPHNFNELIDASIAILNGNDYEIFPDFLTGGYGDFSKYNDGRRGGKVRIRAKINQLDKKTLVISEIPFGTTTTKLIETVIAANDKGKIKIKKIEDNTAQNVEILIHLAPGISPDTTIDALYAFTQCEISISPNASVIENNHPRFVGVKDMLDYSTDNTVYLLKRELEIKLAELMESLMFSSLEKIFIEKKIYRAIETCETWEAVIEAIDKGLQPYKKKFYREITVDDIVRLTEIRIKRISKFDGFKADEIIKGLEEEIVKTQYSLDNLIEYAIAYFNRIKDKFGKGRERRTEIRNFENIEAVKVAVANQKLYVNREEGFAGTSLKKDEFVCDCSDIDEIIAFRSDGTFIVTKVSDKIFVGKDVIHINVFNKNDERTIYNMIYEDGIRGNIMMKRFAVIGTTRDKEYDLTKGTKGSKVLYFTANPNGEAEIVTVQLRPKPKLKKLAFDMDFSELAIKGRNSIGNILTRNPIRKIILKGEGVSTLGAQDIWFDDSVKRLNTDKRGILLGAFHKNEKILTITQSGHYRLVSYELTNHFEEDLLIIEKFKPNKIISAIYYDGELQAIYLKRFTIDVTDKKTLFIGEHAESKLLQITLDYLPRIEIVFKKSGSKIRPNEEILMSEFIGVKSFKAKGKKLSNFPIEEILTLESLPYEEPEVIEEITEEVIEEETVENQTDENEEVLPVEIEAVEEIESVEEVQIEEEPEIEVPKKEKKKKKVIESEEIIPKEEKIEETKGKEIIIKETKTKETKNKSDDADETLQMTLF